MVLNKVHLNAVVSENARFGTIDICDYYLGTDLPTPESLTLYLDGYPPSLLVDLCIAQFVKYNSQNRPYMYADIVKTMPGLPQSGFLSQTRLISHLSSGGYRQTATPMLFRHVERDIDFTLVVDDFGIKYQHDADWDHLCSHLRLLYAIKPHPVGSQFLGFTIVHDRRARTISLSYPGYIASLLARVRPGGVKHAETPSIYHAPNYGSSGPQISRRDSTPTVSDTLRKELQVVVGSILYYARAVDGRMLEAVSELSCLQSQPTVATMAKMERLLGYAAAHPDGQSVIYPSDMLLCVYSDASFNSRPKSQSVAGGYHFLGRSKSPDFLNSPILNVCSTIPIVCAAVSEAEYAAVFANCQVAVDERSMLASLGYPQPPTCVLCDNECAIGLALETVRPKKSKSIDLRLDWVRDRVRQGQFLVKFVAGKDNLADFFTKSLPVWLFNQLAPHFAAPPVRAP